MSLDYSIKTESFQGPLKDLTEAARSHDVPLSRVSISGLVFDFARHLDSRVEPLPLGQAAEYLMVFSELIRLKCRLMLPYDEEPELDEDLEELAEQERGFFQQVASRLRVKAQQRSRLYDTEPDIPDTLKDGITNYEEVTLFELLEAFQDLLETQVEKSIPELELTNEFSTEERIEWMQQRVPVGERCSFLELIGEQPSREEIIVTFLAILHLVKSHRLRLVRTDEADTIQVMGIQPEDSGE